MVAGSPPDNSAALVEGMNELAKVMKRQRAMAQIHVAAFEEMFTAEHMI